jgi:hypothetical protein
MAESSYDGHMRIKHGGVEESAQPVLASSSRDTNDVEADEYSLVASGQMTLPKKPFREDQFWAIVGPARPNARLKKAIRRWITAEREENVVGILGHKRFKFTSAYPAR